MITKITGEQPFQVLTNNFSISPSNEGYTLQISADGKNFSNLFTVGAGVTRLVTGVAANSYYRLSGNQSQVSVNWMKVCVTEGGGAAGNELIPQESLPATADAGTVVALTNGGVYQYDGSDWNAVGSADMSDYWTSAQTEDAISAATAGKADAVNTTANINKYYFPAWNNQGVISGMIGGEFYLKTIKINDKDNIFPAYSLYGNLPAIYAPQSAGTAGDILVSTGGTPVWSAATFAQQSDLNTLSAATESAIATIPENPVQSLSIDTIWKGTQAEYDLITTKDPNTFYIIVSN